MSTVLRRVGLLPISPYSVKSGTCYKQSRRLSRLIHQSALPNRRFGLSLCIRNRSAIADWYRTLLCPQALCWIDFGGAARRVEAGEERHDDEQARDCTENSRIFRICRSHGFRHCGAQRAGQHDAGGNAGAAQLQALKHDHAIYAVVRRANRHAYTDLPGPAAYRVGEHSVEPKHAKNESGHSNTSGNLCCKRISPKSLLADDICHQSDIVDRLCRRELAYHIPHSRNKCSCIAFSRDDKPYKTFLRLSKRQIHERR